MVILSYDTESKSRNADFILIARKGDTTTLGLKAVKLKNPWAEGPSILRTFPFTTLLHNLPPTGGHNPRGEAPSTLTPKACPKSLFFQHAAEGVFFSIFSVFHVDALDFRGEAGEGVDAVY